jgi:hypothetical protein
MCVDEVFTGTGKEGAEVVDLTRYALGARGIDMIEARRVFPTSGPYHLPNPGYSYPLYDGHGNMLSTLVKTSTGYSLQNDKRYDVWGGVLAEASGPGAGLVNPN